MKSYNIDDIHTHACTYLSLYICNINVIFVILSDIHRNTYKAFTISTCQRSCPSFGNHCFVISLKAVAINHI